jgi:hypothetical protein
VPSRAPRAFTDDKNRLSPTPLFGELAGFMRHLEMRRRAEGRPGEMVAQRMNAIVGRVAGVGGTLMLIFLLSRGDGRGVVRREGGGWMVD